jgi:hypothetical protein
MELKNLVPISGRHLRLLFQTQVAMDLKGLTSLSPCPRSGHAWLPCTVTAYAAPVRMADAAWTEESVLHAKSRSR